VPEEVDDFLKGRVLGQLVDVDAAVAQNAARDGGDAGGQGDDITQARVAGRGRRCGRSGTRGCVGGVTGASAMSGLRERESELRNDSS